MKFSVQKMIPLYAWIPLAFTVIVNFIVYIGANIIVGGASRVEVPMIIDDYIPFRSFFIVFYLLAYIQWIVGYLVIARESREYCYKVIFADIIAKLICFLFFVFLPTTMVRPKVIGKGIFAVLTRLVYSIDPATNLFPSIHCLESWAVFRCALKLKLSKWYKIAMGVFSVAVFASVVLVKQHAFIDIPAGVLVFEIGYAITHFTGAHKKIMRLLDKSAKA